MDNSSGRRGEDYACQLIEARGGQVLCRNYASRFGEVDIIACIGQYLVFAEVKTRSSRARSAPQEAVTVAKQRRIMRTALQYLAHQGLNLQPRFDVIALTTDAATGAFIHSEYIENAFGAGGGGYAPF